MEAMPRPSSRQWLGSAVNGSLGRRGHCWFTGTWKDQGATGADGRKSKKGQ